MTYQYRITSSLVYILWRAARSNLRASRKIRRFVRMGLFEGDVSVIVVDGVVMTCL